MLQVHKKDDVLQRTLAGYSAAISIPTPEYRTYRPVVYLSFCFVTLPSVTLSLCPLDRSDRLRPSPVHVPLPGFLSRAAIWDCLASRYMLIMVFKRIKCTPAWSGSMFINVCDMFFSILDASEKLRLVPLSTSRSCSSFSLAKSLKDNKDCASPFSEAAIALEPPPRPRDAQKQRLQAIHRWWRSRSKFLPKCNQVGRFRPGTSPENRISNLTDQSRQSREPVRSKQYCHQCSRSGESQPYPILCHHRLWNLRA